jgi:hypothetical protein
LAQAALQSQSSHAFCDLRVPRIAAVLSHFGFRTTP